MEILAALKTGEVAATPEGKHAMVAGLNWQNWSLRNALTAGYLEQTELGAKNEADRQAEFRMLVCHDEQREP